MLQRLVVGFALCLSLAAAAHAQCPVVGQPTQAFSLREGFLPDPQRRSVTAGGGIDLSRCSLMRATGFVARLPDFVVMYQTNGSGPSRETLTFMTEASADTVLLINDPNERWHFNDDGGSGTNAKISFPNARPGRYDIWVGTYSPGLSRATLMITELP